ncbi:MAG: ECF transporter S component [Eubacteriales bacterium]|nr:ECF transporter S component [Eubacteriales bacterium]
MENVAGANNTQTAAGANKAYQAAVIGVLSSVAVVLMYLEIPVPFMPPFIKFDFSDLPALLGAFALGPAAGVIICLVKNLLHLLVSNSMFVGELSNFMLGSVFVAVASIIYRMHKTKRNALIGGIIGAVAMGLFSVVSNYFVVYPAYYALAMPEEVILQAYQAIFPGVNSILECLIIFNVPFTIVKGCIDVAIAMFIYHPLSPILKGKKR